MSERQLIRIIKDYVAYFNQARPHTCTCVPVQVSGDRATATGAKGVDAWGADDGQGDGTPDIDRAVPRLASGDRSGPMPAKAARG